VSAPLFSIQSATDNREKSAELKEGEAMHSTAARRHNSRYFAVLFFSRMFTNRRGTLPAMPPPILSMSTC